MEEKFLTTNELCELLKVSRRTIERWRKADMPYIKIGSNVRFKQREVLEWIEKNNSNKK